MLKHMIGMVVFAFLTVASSGSAHAVLFNPNDTLALPGTTESDTPTLAGGVEEDDLVPFSFSAYGGTVSGSVQVRVVRSSVDNTLDFYWRVFNDETSAGAIQDFRLGEFYTSSYDANWRIDGVGDVAPISAHRFAGTESSYMNFYFDDTLTPGKSSMFMFLDTDELLYAKTATYDLSNIGQTENSEVFSGYAPAQPVPEPSLLLLLPVALVGLLGYGTKVVRGGKLSEEGLSKIP
jgi:hypothetical protein